MTAFESGGNGVLIPFRLDQLEEFRRNTEEWRRQVDDDRQDLKYLIEAHKQLSLAVDGLRKVIVGFAFSIAASSIVFAFSILVATGKL